MSKEITVLLLALACLLGGTTVGCIAFRTWFATKRQQDLVFSMSFLIEYISFFSLIFLAVGVYLANSNVISKMITLMGDLMFP